MLCGCSSISAGCWKRRNCQRAFIHGEKLEIRLFPYLHGISHIARQFAVGHQSHQREFTLTLATLRGRSLGIASTAFFFAYTLSLSCQSASAAAAAGPVHQTTAAALKMAWLGANNIGTSYRKRSNGSFRERCKMPKLMHSAYDRSDIHFPASNRVGNRFKMHN